MPLRDNLKAQAGELEKCRRDVLYWFQWYPWTYDPRVISDGLPAFQPLDLFPKQVELVKWVQARIAGKEDGLVEKSRDIGFTWVMGGYAWWAWRFIPGFKSTFGSRKNEYVDRIGDPDSIFEKIRMLQASLPPWMLPGEWESNHNLFRNGVTGNTIRGEGGDEMGRGGRNTLYVVDEAAFIERADRVEAATSANTECRIWGSTVNGMENHFARKRHGGTLRPDQIFRFHYTDDPRKTPEWAAKKKATMEPHVWASEYDIDYAASVEGVVIPAKWVEAAKRVKKYFQLEPLRDGIAGGDVGAGKAKSVVVCRFGPIVMLPKSWLDPDTIDTAYKMLDEAQAVKTKRSDGYECIVKSLRYDSPGVGFGVTAALKRSNRKGLMVVGVNTGSPPTDRVWPDGETSEEKFANLKAEGWWMAREAFKSTYEAVLYVETEGKEGVQHPPSELISIPDDTQGPEATQLAAQLSLCKYTRNEKGKIAIESKKSLAGRGIASPDHADALVLTYTGNSKAETWAAFAKNV